MIGDIILTSTSVPFYFLAFIGWLALVLWSYENFKSVIQIIKSILTPYFQPQENKSLVEKYGKWAGKNYRFIILKLLKQNKI